MFTFLPGGRWRAVASGGERCMVASGGGMVGGEQAVACGCDGRAPTLELEGRRALGWGCLLFVKKDGFTLPVAESSVEPTKPRHDFFRGHCDRQITVTDRSLSLSLSVCLCTDNNVRR